MKTAIIVGTRPEIIKLYPIIKNFKKNEFSLIFTGQHYDYNMSLQFFKELKLPNPDFTMKLTKLQNTSTDRATQIGEIILKLSKIITQINPDTVIVQGDTNTVLAASITSLKCSIPVTHIEAGLRSNDWRMPEEHNRIAVDHMSEFLFAPTINAKNNLKNEKVHGQIHVSGNTSIDTIEDCIKDIKKWKNDEGDFVLVTLHRGENVDDPRILNNIITGLIKSKIPIIFPIHPRTMNQLKKTNLILKIKNATNISILPPIGYLEMVKLMKSCKFIVSDSGGIQEEATAPSLRKKVLVIRKTTDRPEAIESGLAELVGTDSDKIIQAMTHTMENSKILSKYLPYGRGNSASKIIKILKNSI